MIMDMSSVKNAAESKLDSEFFAKTEANSQSWGSDAEHGQSLVFRKEKKSSPEKNKCKGQVKSRSQEIWYSTH